MSGERGGRRTVKEQTVLVDVGDNRTVTASSVIKSIEEQVGEGEILACVPKSGNLFEITLRNDDSVDLICDTGFKVGDNKYKPNAVFSRERMVSFLNVSYYVPDSEIQGKLEEFGAELITPIRRRMHPGTQIADGTRYVVIRFPQERQSLPYTMKFSTGINSHEYIRVIHDNQQKVCTKCYETGHVFAKCPDNMCYRCKGAGHLAKACPIPPCGRCKKYPSKCRCEPVWGDYVNVPDDDDRDQQNEEVNDDQQKEQTDDENSEDGDESEETDDTVNKNVHEVTVDVHVNNGQDNDKQEIHVDNDDGKIEMETEQLTIDDNEHDNKFNVEGGSPQNAEGVGVSGEKKTPETSIASENEMMDEELARAMAKVRRKRLVTNPPLSAEDIKKMRSNPRHQLSSSS